MIDYQDPKPGQDPQPPPGGTIQGNPQDQEAMAQRIAQLIDHNAQLLMSQDPTWTRRSAEEETMARLSAWMPNRDRGIYDYIVGKELRWPDLSMPQSPVSNKEWMRTHPGSGGYGQSGWNTFAEAVGGGAGAALQSGVVEPIRGLSALIGLDIPEFDITSTLRALNRKVGGLSGILGFPGTVKDPRALDKIAEEELRMQADWFKTAGPISGTIAKAGHMAGNIGGTFGVGFGRVFTSIGGAAGRGLMAAGVEGVLARQAPRLALKMAEGAGGLGLYELASTTGGGWKRAEATVMGLLTGSTAGLLGELGGKAASWIMRGGGKEAEAMTKYALAKGIAPAAGEAQEAWLSRVGQRWADDGFPGASKMSTRRLVAYATQSAIEATGFAPLDAEFRSKALDPLLHGDFKGAIAGLEKLPESWLGLLLLHAGGSMKSILPWQRARLGAKEDLSVRPYRRFEPADIAAEMRMSQPAETRQEGAEAEVRLPHEEAPGFGKDYPPEQRKFNPEEDLPPGFGREYPRPPEEEPLPGFGQTELDELRRMGWERDQRREEDQARQMEAEGGPPAEEKPGYPRAEVPPEKRPGNRRIFRLQDTDLHFEVQGDRVIPGRRLRELLEIKQAPQPEGAPARQQQLLDSMPASEFFKLLERAQIASNLAAQAYLPGTQVAVGIYAVPPTARKPGTLYTIHFGRVMEKPLAEPEAKWRDADINQMPKKGMRPELEYDQQIAVGEIEALRERRPDLWPEYDGVIDAILAVLRTTPRSTNTSVAEAIPHIYGLNDRLREGAPREEIAQIIMDLGHLLTDKNADALRFDQMNRQQAAAAEQGPQAPEQGQAVEGAGAPTEVPPGETPPQKPPEEPPEEPPPPTGVRPEEPPPTKPLPGFSQEASELARREIESGLEPKGKLQNLAKYWEGQLQKAEAGGIKRPEFMEFVGKRMKAEQQRIAEASAARDIEAFENEGGPSVVGAGMGIPPDLAEAVKTGGKGIFQMLNNVLRRFADSAIKRVEELGIHDVGKQGRQALSHSKKILADLGNRLADFQKLVRTNKEWFSKRVKKGDALFSMWELLKDEDAGKFMGVSRDQLTPEQLDIVKKADEITRELRRMANAVGMKIGGETISPEAEKEVMVRIPTMELHDALQNRRGPVFDQLSKILADLNGIDLAEVEKRWSSIGAMSSRDSMEVKRKFKVFPSAMRMPNGRIVELLEGLPFNQITKMVRAAANRIGVVKAFGQDRTTPESSGNYHDELPVQYRDLVERMWKEHGNIGAQAVADMLRALHGMSSYKPTELDPGSDAYRAARGFNALSSLWGALKLSMGFSQNMLEPWGTPAARLGRDRIRAGYGEVIDALTTGEGWTKLVRDAVDQGFFHHDISDLNIMGHVDMAARARASLRNIGTAVKLPFSLAQSFSELVVGLGLRKMVRDMQSGQGQYRDASFVQQLGFTRAEAEALVNGKGTPEDYASILRSGVAKLMGGRGELGAEKSQFARARTGPNILKFTDYFQHQVSTLRDLAREVRDAKKADGLNSKRGKDAMWRMVEYLGHNLGVGITNKAFQALLVGGGAGLVHWFADMMDDKLRSAGTALGNSLFGGMGQTVANATTALFNPTPESDEVAGQSLTRTIAPFAMGKEFFDFAKAIAGHPDPYSRYNGKTPLDQVGTYMRQLAPITQLAERGLFGIQATAMANDRTIDDALSAYHGWMQRNTGSLAGKPDPVEDSQMELLRAKRAVLAELRAGHGYTDEAFKAKLRTALKLDKEDSLSQYFSRQRVFGSEFEKLTGQQVRDLKATMGPDRWKTLNHYDAVLEDMADSLK